MTSLRLAFWAVCIAGGTISSAHACRVAKSPETRIAEAYAKYPDLQVAIVRVEKARHVSNQMLRNGKKKFPAFELPWRAVASVLRVVKGGDSPQLVLFDRGYSDCDPETPLPATGDIWVVYYTIDQKLYPATVFERYTLDAARQADPRMKEVLAATPPEAHSSP